MYDEFEIHDEDQCSLEVIELVLGDPRNLSVVLVLVEAIIVEFGCYHHTGDVETVYIHTGHDDASPLL